jgi:hypothetical protein
VTAPARHPGLAQQLLCPARLAPHLAAARPLADPPQRQQDLPPLLRVQWALLVRARVRGRVRNRVRVRGRCLD